MRTLFAKDISKLVKATLKQAFPKTAFSVTSKTYSGGSSVSVHWTDGPTWEQVNPILKHFEGSGFDGMQDLKYSLDDIEFRGEHFNIVCDYVQGQRGESDQTLKEAALRVASECNLPVLRVGKHGLEGGNERIPWKYFPADDVLAHDSHEDGGDWYEQVVYQVARKRSFEHAQAVDLPKRMTKQYIETVAEKLVSQALR